MTSLRKRMIEDMQVRNLAVGTQQVYVQQVSLFARHFHKSPELLGPEQIRTYQIHADCPIMPTTNRGRLLGGARMVPRFGIITGLPGRSAARRLADNGLV
jgi:hypothetical protein